MAFAGACSHDIARPVSCQIVLDPANTYLSGEPVRFILKGQADNILFYSGEKGACYRFKDRYSVPIEQVEAAALRLDYRPNYGYPGGLDVYVSKDFSGLKGNDGEADRSLVRQMVDAGMPGWLHLPYEEGASAVWSSEEYDMSAYLENFSLAVHWHPVNDGTSAQRTYWLNGTLTLDMEGTDPASMIFTDLNPIVLTMNEQLDPYHKNAGNGSVRLDNSAAQLVFQGVGKGVLDYALDAWVFTTPSALNQVANDKAVVVKNLQNQMDSFVYTYLEPGNYTASFVCVNADYQGTSSSVQEFSITVVDKL